MPRKVRGLISDLERAAAAEWIRWGTAAALVFVAAYLLHGAAFHSWLSWGPPTPDPEWHRVRSHWFVGAAAVSLVASVLVVRLLRPRRR